MQPGEGSVCFQAGDLGLIPSTLWGVLCSHNGNPGVTEPSESLVTLQAASSNTPWTLVGEAVRGRPKPRGRAGRTGSAGRATWLCPTGQRESRAASHFSSGERRPQLPDL